MLRELSIISLHELRIRTLVVTIPINHLWKDIIRWFRLFKFSFVLFLIGMWIGAVEDGFNVTDEKAQIKDHCSAHPYVPNIMVAQICGQGVGKCNTYDAFFQKMSFRATFLEPAHKITKDFLHLWVNSDLVQQKNQNEWSDIEGGAQIFTLKDLFFPIFASLRGFKTNSRKYGHGPKLWFSGNFKLNHSHKVHKAHIVGVGVPKIHFTGSS